MTGTDKCAGEHVSKGKFFPEDGKMLCCKTDQVRRQEQEVLDNLGPLALNKLRTSGMPENTPGEVYACIPNSGEVYAFIPNSGEVYAFIPNSGEVYAFIHNSGGASYSGDFGGGLRSPLSNLELNHLGSGAVRFQSSVLLATNNLVDCVNTP